MSEQQTLDQNRCAVCGWPLARTATGGCVRGNCAMRPLPRPFYDAARVYEEYGGRFGEPTPPATPQPETCEWPDCHQPALCQSGNFGNRLVCREHFQITNAALSPPPDVERLTREAFRAGFLAVCRKKSDDTPLDMLTRVWTFDGVAAADLEPEAYAAWCALSSPSTQEHATVCEWRPYEFRNGNYYALVGTCCEVAEEMPVLRRAVKKWKCCPYCTLPLKLSPESPNEGAK